MFFKISVMIIICVYGFELFSQVSDVAHGPLVSLGVDTSIGTYSFRYALPPAIGVLTLVGPGCCCVAVLGITS